MLTYVHVILLLLLNLFFDLKKKFNNVLLILVNWFTIQVYTYIC